MPRIERVRNGPYGNFPCVWTTTDAIRAKPFAIGCADITPAQLADINADGKIHIFEEGEWMTRFSQLAGTRRSALNTFLTTIGVVNPLSTEVVRDICNRIINVIDNKTFEGILDELAAYV